MKLFLVTILVGGAFFGGYHFGHKEGSPDLTGWVQQAYPKVVQAARDAIASMEADAAKPADPKPAADASTPATDQSDLYRAATDAVQAVQKAEVVQKQVQTHPEWDPRYWNARAPQTRQP
jgi:hypothetical protein